MRGQTSERCIWIMLDTNKTETLGHRHGHTYNCVASQTQTMPFEKSADTQQTQTSLIHKIADMSQTQTMPFEKSAGTEQTQTKAFSKNADTLHTQTNLIHEIADM